LGEFQDWFSSLGLTHTNPELTCGALSAAFVLHARGIALVNPRKFSDCPRFEEAVLGRIAGSAALGRFAEPYVSRSDSPEVPKPHFESTRAYFISATQ